MDLAFEKKLNDILSEAFERPTGERRAFLEETCGDDDNLLTEALIALEQEEELGDPTKGPGAPQITATVAPDTTVFERGRWGDGEAPPRDGLRNPLTPEIVGHYRILGRLGKGGMGTVYRAEDTRLGRVVAIKFLRRELDKTPEAKARFLREARAASRLDHPNICNLHEIAETPTGRLYMVMTCYQGETLQQRLARGPLPTEVAVRVACQIAAGLDRAHREGIVHRDIKPANIFLTDSEPHDVDWVKVLDFGIAKLTGDASLTITGLSVGTPYYMAPEQALGDSDHRADLWSLGIILYEMVTGARPFDGPTHAAIVRSLMHDPAPPLSERLPDAPQILQDAVERALSKDPKLRFQKASELAAALAPLVPNVGAEPSGVVTADLASTPSKPPTDVATPTPVAPRRRLLPWVAAIAVAALAIFGLWRSRLPLSPLSQEAPPQTATAPAAVAVLPFEVRGADDYRYLREGMVDLLSTKLDGAGDVRAIETRALMRRLDEQPNEKFEPDSGAELARRLEADLMILGEVLTVADQLRFDAVLYRLAEGSKPERVTSAAAEGPAKEVFALVDQLATQLLTGMEDGAGSHIRRLAAITSESFPALKAYLEGESAWRAGHFRDAAQAFEIAVAEDPGFALAWYRLSMTRLWLLDLEGYAAALGRAIEHAERLAPDDRRLLDVLMALNRGDKVAAERLCREVLSHRPDDLEAWSALGEVEFHLGPVFGRSMTYSRRSWERVLELEPDDRQAHLNLARLDVYEGRHRAVAERAERLRILLAGSERATEILFFESSIPEAENARLELREILLRSELGMPWLTAGYSIAPTRLHKDFWASLYRELVTPDRAPREQTFGHRHLGVFALAAGRMQLADKHLTTATHPPELTQEHRALAATLPFVPVPDERLQQLTTTVDEWPIRPTTDFSLFEPHARFPAHHRLYMLGLLHARAGDSMRALKLADELAAAGEIESVPGLARDLEAGLRADISFRQMRYHETLRLLAERHSRYSFEMPQVSPLFSQGRERYLKAESLLELGRLDEAYDWYESLSETSIFDLAYRAISHQRRAEIRDRQGQTQQAAEHYRRFVELWQNADPELQPGVEAARRWLAEHDA